MQLTLLQCDRIGLLAFHLALVNNPQDALVIWAFASTLYYGKWKGASQFANKCAKLQVNFVPEISGSSSCKSALAESVSNLASLVQESVSILSDTDRLIESMTRYPHSSCSGLVSMLFVLSTRHEACTDSFLYATFYLNVRLPSFAVED